MKARRSSVVRSVNARDRIVATAAELFHSKGYAATGIDEILRLARATKGSFHHHFGSKKKIALAVVKDVVRSRFSGRMLTPILNASKPLDAVRRIIYDLRTKVSTADLLTGCPINNLSSELALQDGKLQRTLADLFAEWQDEWARVLSKEHRLLRKTGFKNPRQLSIYLVAAIEGAQAMAKAQQSREPLDTVLKHLEAMLSP
jgi:TetR/AcrR family transcriptional regulator, transcriptional repressor for nem operon